jgi:hypothetical protein
MVDYSWYVSVCVCVKERERESARASWGELYIKKNES